MAEPINNREHRIEQLKQIIRKLHGGEEESAVRDELKEIVQQTDASEIAAMEQELMAEGMPLEEVMGMCDLHAKVVQDIFVQRETGPIKPGHPIDTIRKENEAITGHVAQLRETVRSLTTEPDGETLHRCRHLFNELRDIEKHYARKENVLFPYLEKHQITGPSKVMWAKDDEVRELMKAMDEALSVEDADAGQWQAASETVIEPCLQAIEEMVSREDHIMIPMALDALTAAEWGEVWEQSKQFGWCLVEPGEEYEPPQAVLPAQDPGNVVSLTITGESDPTRTPANALHFPSGSMTPTQILAIFNALPVDVTFVDADDRVRFFSEGGGRVFARSKAIIGRKVQHCHPPASVNVVERILDDFHAGRENACSFWINFNGRFVYIRYFALRDDRGAYIGTLEVTQDLTEERALEGERRLLEYEAKG